MAIRYCCIFCAVTFTLLMLPKSCYTQANTCQDYFYSTVVKIYSHGTFGDFKKLSNGDVLAAATFYGEIRLLRMNQAGQIVWEKAIDKPNLLTNNGFPVQIWVSPSDEIYVSALRGELYKFSKDGVLLWSKNLPFPEFANYYVKGIGILPDGDWIFWVREEYPSICGYLVRMKPDLKQIVWSKRISLNELYELRNLIVDGFNIIIHGGLVNAEKKVAIRVLSIDHQTGNILHKVDVNGKGTNAMGVGLKKRKQNYLIWISSKDVSGLVDYELTVLDEKLSPTKSYSVNSIPYSSVFEMTDDGSIIGNSGDLFFKLDPQGMPVFSFKNYINFLGGVPYYSLLHNGIMTVMNVANFLFYVGEGKFGSEQHFYNVDTNGIMATCMGQVDVELQVEKVTVPIKNPDVISIDSILPFRFLDTSAKAFIPESFVYERCVTKSDCNEVKIEKPFGTLCEGSTLILKATKNENCKLPVQWRILETDGYNISSTNDSAATITFRAAGQYKVLAQVGSCRISTDTVTIHVNKAVHTSLPADISFCVGDSFLLNAGTGFKSYLWQDGSRDSVLKVKTSGTYIVSLTDFCNNSLQVSTQAMAIFPPDLDAGIDTSVCFGDTLGRTASKGFETYIWSDLSTQEILSNNSKLGIPITSDRRIFLKATTAMGCIKNDTFSVQLISARHFDLGDDLNLCAGDTVNVSGGLGYMKYQWNNGDLGRSINIWQVGTYTLAATDVNGCIFQDTISVNKVFSLPKPNLGEDRAICQGTSLQLNPGLFYRYLWHNGNSNATIQASNTGLYAVRVWDENNCSGNDTMFVSSVLPLPTNFLNARDSICQYEKLQLKPSTTFKNYLWSTGSTQQVISVEKSGLYVLRVTDNNNCIGQDSIVVVMKSCMEGLYVPNAFTPNKDGLNDIFKPLLFGNIQAFKFEIYNRFGHLVFSSDDYTRGWDGSYKGLEQPTGNYIWKCSYSMNGGKLQIQKGSFILVR